MNAKQVFLRVVEIEDPAAREKVLDAECEGNPDLRAEVERLLQADGQSLRGLDDITVTAGPMPQYEFSPKTRDGDRKPSRGEPFDTFAFLGSPRIHGSMARFKHFELLEEVGRGGFGVVYRAKDVHLDRQIALKLLHPFIRSEKNGVRRFIGEARRAAQITSPHIIVIHEIGEPTDEPYIIMEYVPGRSLAEKLIQNAGPLEVPQIINIAEQIAIALEAAHERGVVHRDVKPQNILLRNGLEKVVVTDFGIAHGAGGKEYTLTPSGALIGSPSYMSPEQIDGRVDARSDLFSLGSVIYEMCTGNRAFDGKHPVKTMALVSACKPTPIRHINPNIPRWLINLVARLHKRDPENRLQTAAEVVAILAARRKEFESGTEPRDPVRSGGWKYTIATAMVIVASLGLAAALWAFTPRQTHDSVGSSPSGNSSSSDEKLVPPRPASAVGQPKGFPLDPRPGEAYTIALKNEGVEFTVRWIPRKGRAGGFWMGETEVTQELWSAVGVMVDGKSNPSVINGSTYPVTDIPWSAAKEFCDKLSQETQLPISLPTEAQWEYACRADARTAYSFGDDPKGLADYAWYQANSGGHPNPVRQKNPNAWGLYDMHGNVWEFCVNRRPPNNNPAIRGGSWDYPPETCAAGYFSSFDLNVRNSGLGFRFIISVAPSNPSANASVAEQERTTVAHCVELVRECFMNGGAIRMSSVGDKVWVCPYFANFAALGLLSAHERVAPNAEDLHRVGEWLKFYAQHQNQTDGTINDLIGTVSGGIKDNGHRDSEDSFAATYCLVVAKHHRLTKDTPADVRAAANLALKAIEAVVDPADGLTWAKRDYKVKYLMDNLEVRYGLLAAAEFWQAVGDDTLAKKAANLATGVEKGLAGLWDADRKLYAWAKHEDGKLEIGLQKAYPDGLANLMGLAWGSQPDPALWTALTTTLSASQEASPDAPVEYWYMASLRAGSPVERVRWRAAVAGHAAGYSRDTYVHRAGLAVLGLLEGSAWAPGGVTPDVLR